MNNLITDVKEVLSSRNLVSLLFNVPNEEDIPAIKEFLVKEGVIYMFIMFICQPRRKPLCHLAVQL